MTRGASRHEPAAKTRACAGQAEIALDRAALFLDLDGTLAPIALTPGAVTLGEDVKAVVRRAVEMLDGRVAVISGRTIEEVDRILGPGLRCVAGVHGLQRRTESGSLDIAEPHVGLEEARRIFGIIAKAEQRLLVEEKGLSIALHYRRAPRAEAAVNEISEHLTERTGLVLQKGDMVAELKTPGPDKGGAVRAFMAETPFAGAVPVFVGDDVTDEAGFLAVGEFGGFGVLVGPERQTFAVMRLDDPKAVLRWIEKSLLEGAFRVEARA